jgi:hypothetical protein
MIESTEQTARTSKRLKKDGTPDRRGGKPGNVGNRHATGKKAVPGKELRKQYNFVATDEEYNLLKRFNAILRVDPAQAATILSKLGTPPAGRARKDGGRKNRAMQGTEAERAALKRALATIKDRYLLSYDVISEAEGQL